MKNLLQDPYITNKKQCLPLSIGTPYMNRPHFNKKVLSPSLLYDFEKS